MFSIGTETAGKFKYYYNLIEIVCDTSKRAHFTNNTSANR